jgi:hypothetical protein
MQRHYIDFKLYLTRAPDEQSTCLVALLPTTEVGESRQHIQQQCTLTGSAKCTSKQVNYPTPTRRAWKTAAKIWRKKARV